MGVGIDIQVTPVVSSTDTFQHVLDETCWCRPVIEHIDSDTGNRVIVHDRYIDGQGYEPEPDPTGPETHEGEPE